jgi:hypothetical protein
MDWRLGPSSSAEEVERKHSDCRTRLSNMQTLTWVGGVRRESIR